MPAAGSWLSGVRLRLREFLFEPLNGLKPEFFKFEGREFIRPVDQTWAEEFLNIRTEGINSFGAGIEILELFTYSLNFNFKMPNLIFESDDILAMYADAFRVGRQFHGPANEFSGFIETCSVIPSIEDEGWLIRGLDVGGQFRRPVPRS